MHVQVSYEDDDVMYHVRCREHLDEGQLLPTGAATEEEESPEQAVFYYIDESSTQQGPVALDDLSKLLNDLVITAKTPVWTAGLDSWRTVESLEF